MEPVRGIDHITGAEPLEVGAFYLDPGYGRGTTLFQWVLTGEQRDGEPEATMLVFASDVGDALELQTLHSPGPFVKMPQVSVRVDPPSATGTAMSQALAPGMLVVEADRPLVVAKIGFRSRLTIDMSTGRPVRAGHAWVGFSRWSLVVDEAGEEIAIASFGDADSET